MPRDSRAAPSPTTRAAISLLGSDRATILLFGATLFLSATLLFSVQPLFARLVLPRLGGTPAVWSVALVFFQTTLLGGYAYAHVLMRSLGLPRAVIVHALVLGLAAFWLPVGVAQGFDVPPQAGLPFWLLALFAVSIGAPVFAISANAPLLQAWFSRTGHKQAADPYFLYGASNLGSILALLAYPLLAEPLFTLGAQSRLWTGLYAGLALAVICCGVSAARGMAGAPASHEAARAPAPAWADRARWMALAFVPSALLVAVTAHLSTNIAAMPLLWVLPLAAFLLTFVLAFQRPPLFALGRLVVALPVACVAAMLTYGLPVLFGGLAGIAINLAAFFVVALVWHSALANARPPASSLTEFYLLMSAGGVLGGAFTSLAAPLIFNSVAEFPLLLILSLLIVPEARKLLRRRVALAGLAALLVGAFVVDRARVEYRDRSFFGVVSTRVTGEGGHRLLVHGTTVHGAELLADASGGGRPHALTYFAPDGPLARAIAMEQGRRAAPLEVGIVGLGIGSLACFRRPADTWRFYEIDPAVIRAATDPALFTFLEQCAPEAEIVLGDARLSLAAEAGRRFDVLVIDAFSSDAIPAHLLTREALRLYAERIGPDGVVLMHISNQFMELASVIAAGAAEEGLSAARILHRRPLSDAAAQKFSSDVVALALRPAAIAPYRDAGWSPLTPRSDVAAWTDDFSNVVGAILRMQGLL